MKKMTVKSQSSLGKATQISSNCSMIRNPCGQMLRKLKPIRELRLRDKGSLIHNSNETSKIIPKISEQKIVPAQQSLKQTLNSLNFSSIQHFSNEEISLENYSFKQKLSSCVETLKKLKTENRSFSSTLNSVVDILNEVALEFENQINLIRNFSKVSKKLKDLSEENIELSKKLEKYKGKIYSLKNSSNYNETRARFEKLAQEISVKNEYICKCEEEIRDLKRRELKILKKLDRKVYNYVEKDTVADSDDSPIVNPKRRDIRAFSIPLIQMVSN